MCPGLCPVPGLVGLPYEEFTALFPQVKRDALHLEMRDSYSTEAEIPHLAKWPRGNLTTSAGGWKHDRYS
jgi:hypothetical protein